MKLFFFIVAFCLIFLRAWFSWSGHNAKDNNDGTMTISSGDYFEQIKWSGKVQLSDDEKSIVSIATGGYLKFRENDKKMIAESNLQGEISYQLYDGHENLSLNDSGRHFISAVLKEIIARGFNAEGRADRIYKNGGYRAVLNELPNLKMDYLKGPYIDLLFKNDSLGNNDLAGIISQIGNAGSDAEKENLLKHVTVAQLKDSLVTVTWINVAAHMNADIDKTNLLSFFIDQDSLTDKNFEDILQIITHLNADIDKVNMFTHLINKAEVKGGRWSQVLNVANHFNADIDKATIYRRLMEEKEITEDQWMALIKMAAQQNADMDKSNLLVLIAAKMPRTEKIKAAYLQAAKTINNDADYGRAVKLVE